MFTHTISQLIALASALAVAASPAVTTPTTAARETAGRPSTAATGHQESPAHERAQVRADGRAQDALAQDRPATGKPAQDEPEPSTPVAEGLVLSSSAVAGVPMGEHTEGALLAVEPLLGEADWATYSGSCSDDGVGAGVVLGWHEGLVIETTLTDDRDLLSGWQLHAPIEGLVVDPALTHGMSLTQAQQVAPDLVDVSLNRPTWLSQGVMITLGQDGLVESVRTESYAC